MSHFAVLVIGDAYEEQLAQYDETLVLDMHQTATKEELIKKCRQSIENYKNGLYAEYLKDPEGYKAECKDSPGHLKYISETFPKKLQWTDEECYEAVISDYRDYIADGADWCEIHDDGSLWETTNEHVKWDWYQMGGRYRGLLKLKEPNPDAPLYTGWQYGKDDAAEYERLKREGYCDRAAAGDVSNLEEVVPFAIVKDYEWYERGEMGWWAIVSNEKPEDVWEREVKALLKDLPPETMLTVVDCHI